MALNPNNMANLMKTAFLATPPTAQTLDTFCLAIATAVCAAIAADAVVIPGTFTTAGGPVTGNGKVT